MEDEYPSSFQGFKIMRLKFSEESKAAHQILWKRHSVRTYCESKPPDRTLFVVNLPPYCTEASIRHLFSRYGDIRNVYFHKKPSSDLPDIPKYPNFSKVTPVKGFKVAYVVFTNVSGIKCAMEASSADVLILSTPKHPVLTGVRKWREEYNKNFISSEDLNKEIQQVMDEYDREKEEIKSAAKVEEEADEDGWVTVTSKKVKKKPQLLKKHEFKKQTKRKKKQRELVKFYAFQDRQSKMDNLAQLRKRFEEDKKRINMMKAARKFKPY